MLAEQHSGGAQHSKRVLPRVHDFGAFGTAKNTLLKATAVVGTQELVSHGKGGEGCILDAWIPAAVIDLFATVRLFVWCVLSRHVSGFPAEFWFR